MVEQRKFQMHEKLLLDVIKKQAGSVQKAVLEGVMNSIEAGATSVTVDVRAGEIVIHDDGRGFRDRKEIEMFFETFGQPHEASEGKKWAQFRMGRGQMFAFGKNTWKTGRFVMEVDIEQRLGYDLTEQPGKPEGGCLIAIALYEKLTERDIYSITKEIGRYVKWVSVPVYVNGEQVNTDPSGKKWGVESNDEAWIRLTDGQRLEIYNMGVLVCDVPKFVHGVSGTIISKKRLDVNFARNDIIKSCPVWKSIKKAIEASAGVQKVKTKRTLDPDERFNLIARICAGEMDINELYKTKLFLDVTGHAWSPCEINNSGFKTWTFAEKGNMKGDKLMQAKAGLVLDEEVVRAFDCKPDELFSTEFPSKSGRLSKFFWKDIKYTPFKKMSDSINTSHILVPEDEWTPNEIVWRGIANWLAESLGNYGGDGRSILIGSSDSADAWTDGETYIALGREMLRRLKLEKMGRPDVGSLTELCTIIAHELAHDEDSRTNIHSPEFYNEFHDIVFGEKKNEYGYRAKSVSAAVSRTFDMLLGGKMDKLREYAKQQQKKGSVEVPAAPIGIEVEEEAVAKRAPTKEKERVMSKRGKGKKKIGRTAADIEKPGEIKKIAHMYKGLGGKLSFERIEYVTSLKLRQANGMTAYRIVQKFKKQQKAAK